MASFTIGISIECEDNADGYPGVVVNDDKTFPIPSQHDVIERTASGDGQGPYSSVQPFQPAHHENEDPATDDAPETDSYSLCSDDEEEEDEEDEEEKMTGIHQQST